MSNSEHVDIKPRGEVEPGAERNPETPAEIAVAIAAEGLGRVEEHIAAEHPDAPADVIKEGTDEAVASLLGAAEVSGAAEDITDTTSIAVLEVVGHPGANNTARALDEVPIGVLEKVLHTVEDGLGDDGSTAVGNVIEAIDRFNHDGGNAAYGPGEILDSNSGWEQLESSGQELSSAEIRLREVRARAELMAREGKERTDFAGYEVYKAIEGFYNDHETILSIVASVASGEDVSGIVLRMTKEGLVSSKNIQDALEELSGLQRQGDDKVAREYAGRLLSVAYAEPCVGMLTLDEEQTQDVLRRRTELRAELTGGGVTELSHTQERYYVEQARKKALAEVRPAGQLLFHNTVHGMDVWYDSAIKGRDRQITTTGRANEYTAPSTDMPGHSRIPHFSELYDPVGYKQSFNHKGEGIKGSEVAATVAVPLAEIIKRAPIGRGLHYAIVTAALERKPKVNSILEKESTLGFIGPGGSDAQGWEKPTIDRVFWAGSDSEQTASDYEVPFSGAKAMTMLNSSVEAVNPNYLIQSENDLLVTFKERNSYGAEPIHRLPANPRSRFGPSEPLDMRQHFARFDLTSPSSGSGTGYGYPGRLFIKDRPDLFDEQGVPTSVESDGREKPEMLVMKSGSTLSERQQTMAKVTEGAIRGIQEESIARYAGHYVVPLRVEEKSFMLMGDASVAQTTFVRPYGGYGL